MNKKEILIVTISLGNDGAERVLTELAREWVKNGHKVTILQTSAKRYNCEYELDFDVEKIYINATSKNKIIHYLQEIYQLIKILKTKPNCCAVSFLSASSFILAISSWFVKNKIIFSERNDPRKCPVGLFQQKLRNFAFKFADVCVFQTEDAKEYFSKRIQRKGVIIPNPINGKLPSKFTGKRKKTIVTACRLHPQKNLKMMIDAFKLLHDEYPDYKLIIYGQGVLEEELHEYINSLGLDKNILMPGFEKDIMKKMIDSKMFVSSSDYEGISNSMLEAMGMGLPVVVTDCPIGGARMMITNNENGILVPVGDTVALYEGMKKIIEDNDFTEKLSNNAYKIRDLYPLNKIAKKWIDIM